jgi:biotin carboxyl carrier protein
MIRATVNQQKTYLFTDSKDGQLIDNELFDIDFVSMASGKFHFIHQNKSYVADVIQANYQEKTFTIQINQSVVEIQLKDKFDLLLQEMGISNTAINKINVLKAPMPGLIIDIKAKVGQEIKKGDVLVILEAMKMENVIKAQGDGVVKLIKIIEKENVEKGQTLIEFE